MSYHMLYTNISTFKRIFPTYRYEITYEKKQETYERTNIKKYLTRFLDRWHCWSIQLLEVRISQQVPVSMRKGRLYKLHRYISVCNRVHRLSETGIAWVSLYISSHFIDFPFLSLLIMSQIFAIIKFCTSLKELIYFFFHSIRYSRNMLDSYKLDDFLIKLKNLDIVEIDLSTRVHEV